MLAYEHKMFGAEGSGGIGIPQQVLTKMGRRAVPWSILALYSSLFAHTFPEPREDNPTTRVGKYGRRISELFGLEKYGTFAAHLKLGRQRRNSLYVP